MHVCMLHSLDKKTVSIDCKLRLISESNDCEWVTFGESFHIWDVASTLHQHTHAAHVTSSLTTT